MFYFLTLNLIKELLKATQDLGVIHLLVSILYHIPL